MKPESVQTACWWAFLIYYTGYKYLAALNVWDTEYAIQVAILVLATAVAPFYVARLVTTRIPENLFIISAIVVPGLLSLVGYAVFYYTRVLPFFPEVALSQVLPRSIFPGICMAFILLVPWMLNKLDSPS